MNIQLFQKKLGERIADLRKSKSLSQADLAKFIGISRPSMVQIELGNRSIDVFELKELSRTLNFSIDQFLSDDFTSLQLVEEEIPVYQSKAKIRNSIPELKVSKLNTVFIYILEHCAGNPQIDEQALNQILYFCDFNYYEIFEEQLTGAEYRKSSKGPVFTKFNLMVNEMIKKGLIQRIKVTHKQNLSLKLIPLVKADLLKLVAAEKWVIDQVLLQINSWNALMLSEYSLRDMPCMATPEGENISYNLVFYRELPYSVRIYDEEK